MASAATPGPQESRNRWRLDALMLTLALSLPFAGALRALLFPHHYSQPELLPALYGLLGYEAVVLVLFVSLLRKHPAGFRELSLRAEFKDLPIAIGLMLGSYFAAYFTSVIVYAVQYASTGRQPVRPEFQNAFSTGLNLGTAALLLINPFYEEWILRGFLMREMEALTGRVGYAIFVSVFLQAFYHTYQGIPAALAIAACFLVFSVYYARTKKIVPVILAHMFFDILALYFNHLRH